MKNVGEKGRERTSAKKRRFMEKGIGGEVRYEKVGGGKGNYLTFRRGTEGPPKREIKGIRDKKRGKRKRSKKKEFLIRFGGIMKKFLPEKRRKGYQEQGLRGKEKFWK